MGRYKIIELLLVIYFIGIPNLSECSVEKLLELSEAQSKLSNRLLSYYRNVANRNPEEGSSSYEPPLYNDNDDENTYPVLVPNDEIIFDLLQFWYTLFWVSMNLKIRSMVHKMKYIENTSRKEEKKNAQYYDSLFDITSNIFQILKSGIEDNYTNMQNMNICGSTSKSSDMAESVWEELLNLNLEFIMSTDDLKNREHNNEYKDGLVKWSEINYAENGYKTILPNNTPTDTDYFVFDEYCKKSKNYEVIQGIWRVKMITSIINIEIHEKIINCFTNRLIGKPLLITAEPFMATGSWTVTELKEYLKKFKKGRSDIHKIITAIQMVNFFTEEVLIFITRFIERNTEMLVASMKQNLEERKKNFFQEEL